MRRKSAWVGSVLVVRFPDTYRWGEKEPRSAEESLQGLADVIQYEGGHTIAAIILAPLGAALLQMSLSRRREYLADATAAELTGDPEGLARPQLDPDELLGREDLVRDDAAGHRGVLLHRALLPVEGRVRTVADRPGIPARRTGAGEIGRAHV